MALISFDDVVGSIERSAAPGGPVVVAIDGPAGSGKSTLARRLARRMVGASLVETDDFTSWPDPTGRTWWPRFDTQVLTPAFAGEPLHYQLRDWQADEFGDGLGGWRDLPAARVVIIEGVTSARAAMRDRGAFAIWVEAPAELRMTRAVERDGDSHHDLWLAWMEAEQEFFAADGTKEAANLRVDGAPSEPHDPEADVVLL